MDKLRQRFGMFGYGAPIPLRIPATSCLVGAFRAKLKSLGGAIKDCWLCCVLLMVILGVMGLMGLVNYKAFKQDHVTRELTKEEIKASAAACMAKRKDVLYVYDNDYRVYYTRCIPAGQASRLK